MRVGLAGAFSDPDDPLAWSGVPANLARALARLGVYAGYRDAVPWAPLFRAAHWWMVRTGRGGSAWMLKPEVRTLFRVSDAMRRAVTPPNIAAWITIGGVRPARGRMATLCDLAPYQFLHIVPDDAISYWWPEGTIGELRAHARRTAAIHRAAYTCCVASRWAGRSMVENHGIDPRRVHVVGLGQGVDHLVEPQREWSSPRFLFVGRDWKRKNGEAVVRAFVEVRRFQPRATLDVVAPHPPLSVEGVTGHGDLSWRQDEDEMAALLGRATCFVMPSLIEPYGMAYVEAAANGIASIATSVGGTEESVGPGGILVDPHDGVALIDAMRRMCDPEQAASLGARAKDHAGLLTWDAVAQRILRALDLEVTGLELAQFL